MTNKRVATVNGACGNKINATVSLDARGTPIVGSFVTIQSGTDVILGRIVEVELKNPIHDDDLFAPLIMQKGRLPFWSGDVDIERAKVEILGVMDVGTMTRIPLRANAASGTEIFPADRAAIDLFSIEKQHFLVLGTIPNSGGLPQRLINRHCGEHSDKNGRDLGGHGEAQHIGIFGQNGSGKTVLLTMLIAGRLAAHPQMGLLMPDTSGDLADPARHSRGPFRWNYAEVLRAANVEIERIPIEDIRLTATSTLKEKLKPLLVQRINMHPNNAERLADMIVDALFGTDDVNPTILTTDNVLQQAFENIAHCYSGTAQKKQKTEEIEALRSTNRRAIFDRDLAELRAFFDGRYEIRNLVRDVLENGRKIVLDMHSISHKDHRFVMSELIKRLVNHSVKMFRSENRTSNAIVVLDEGQRWVPEGKDDSEGLSDVIQDGFRTTRKYGIGWFIVAQSPAGLSNRVIRECRTWFFGRNLGIGADQKHLESILGQDGAAAYQQLAIQGDYFWVCAGQDNNLATGSTYFSLHPFGGNATQAFIEANQHIFAAPRVIAAAE